jgi:hypothetical protein
MDGNLMFVRTVLDLAQEEPVVVFGESSEDSIRNWLPVNDETILFSTLSPEIAMSYQKGDRRPFSKALPL